MRAKWIGITGLLVLMLLSACKPTELQMPDDFALVFTWGTGALPPQYCYSYVITIGPGPQGEFEYTPGIDGENDTDFWVTPLEISNENLQSLFDHFEQNGFFSNKWKSGENLLGGSSTSLVITAFGKDHRVSSISTLTGEDLQAVQTAQDLIRTFVPQSVWDEMNARQAAYEASWID